MALFPTYQRFNLTVKQAKGTVIEDVNGREYLDFGSGIGVTNLGHRHPVVQYAVEQQLNAYWHLSNLYENKVQDDVADELTAHSVGDYVFFCNSGAEANEAAIKLARRATGKEKIITFNESFHGRTFATMAATGQDKVRMGFGSMLEKFAYAKFNDINSVKKILDADTAAIMIEVVQGEGGIHLADRLFLNELAKLCDKNKVLLILDEVQTGIGRTGKKFAYEHYGIEPDIFTLAKGLGNGIPVGAMVAKRPLNKYFGPGTHGSTFGGNPIAMAAAKAVTSIVFTEDFLSEVNAKATYLASRLEEQISPCHHVKDIRQLGLMVGIELDEKVGELLPNLLKKRVLALSAGEYVLRLLPPLTISKLELDQGVQRFKETIEEMKVKV